MEQWLESVYSDGTDCFVSNPQPELFETVTVWIRLYADAPVRAVFVRTAPNGTERLIQAEKRRVEGKLCYYGAEIRITEERMHYHFYLACDNVIYYYNQKEITTCIPDETCDFVLLTGYRQPSWVKHAVFYQIFPERFFNGNPDNDVKDGEYTYEGWKTRKIPDWESPPLPYSRTHALDFYGGDLEGIRKKIPYLQDLGVNALYLNPVFRSPTTHKYDCVDYLHVDEHFGGDQALADLSKALHERGMRLILDISVNHTGAGHRWFNRDGIFFDPSEGAYHNPDSPERSFYFFEEGSNRYQSWFGVENLPVLNYQSQELRNRIYAGQDAVLRKWLREPYSIDGWRFDVADVMARNNEVQLSHEIWPQIRKSLREENPEAYILAEHWGDCGDYLQGEEWDSAMNYFGCARVLREFLGLNDLFIDRNEVLRKIPYHMRAEDVEKRITSYLARMPWVIRENQFNLLDSHDIPRIHNFPAISKEEYQGAVILQFMLAGTPCIYYGDEIGIDGELDGDQGYRYPMPWSKVPEKSEPYVFFQRLAHLKRSSRALTEGGMKFLYAQGDVLALARFYKQEVITAIMSVSDQEQSIRLPLASIGADRPKGDTDFFGNPLHWKREDDKSIRLFIPAHRAYLMECIREGL